MTVQDATRLLTDEAELLGADPEDSTGVVRQLVTAHGLEFYAWFVVCCELGSRKRERNGNTLTETISR